MVVLHIVSNAVHHTYSCILPSTARADPPMKLPAKRPDTNPFIAVITSINSCIGIILKYDFDTIFPMPTLYHHVIRHVYGDGFDIVMSMPLTVVASLSFSVSFSRVQFYPFIAVLLFIVIVQSGFDGFFCKYRTVHLVVREAVKSLRHGFVGEFHGF